MENLEVILSLIGTALSLLITCVIFVVRTARIIKAKKQISAQSVLDEALIPLIEIAENFKNYSGEEKLEYVLTRINRFSLDNGIDFDADGIKAKIEELIGLSKKVNAGSQSTE